MGDTLIIPSISIDQRLDALYAKLVNQFAPNGGSAKLKIQPKIVRGFGQLVNNGPGPQIQICQLQANPVGGTVYPAQQLVQQTDGYVFVGMKAGIVKAATTAKLKSARKYTYADLTTFAASGENDSVQSLFSGGLISMFVNQDLVLQPLAMSYFENVPQVQAAAATLPANPTYNNSFQLLNDDYGVSGGNQNYFLFDLTNCDTAAISPVVSSQNTNYIFVELVGYNIQGANSIAMEAAKANGLCL